VLKKYSANKNISSIDKEKSFVGEPFKKNCNWQRNALLLRLLTLLADEKLIPAWQTMKRDKSGSSEREPSTERMNYMQKTPLMEMNNLTRQKKN